MSELISRKYLWLIIHGRRTTLNPEIAIMAAEKSGKLPIDHINPKVKDAYLKAYPEIFTPKPKKRRAA